MDLVNGFKCECPRGYYDARCLSDVDECASSKFKQIRIYSISILFLWANLINVTV